MESPLEQCISDSMVRSKDGGNIFSLMPNGVAKAPHQPPPEESDPLPISSPDSFSDFFKVIGTNLWLNVV